MLVYLVFNICLATLEKISNWELFNISDYKHVLTWCLLCTDTHNTSTELLLRRTPFCSFYNRLEGPDSSPRRVSWNTICRTFYLKIHFKQAKIDIIYGLSVTWHWRTIYDLYLVSSFRTMMLIPPWLYLCCLSWWDIYLFIFFLLSTWYTPN